MEDLAIAFSQFQKSPGRDDKWVEKVIAAMERAWPDEHAKLGRLANFTAKLSEITKFRDEERAAAVAGIFFQIVGTKGLEGEQPASQAWIEYFSTNLGYYDSAYEVVRALRTNDAEGWGGPASSVARIAVLFENETKSRKRGPLQLLHTLRDEADTPVMERVVEALWTEEGQELCSQGSRAARLSNADLAALVSESLKVLRGAPVRPRAAASERAADGPLSAPIRSSTKRGASDLVASLASATSERKKALRASLIPEAEAEEAATESVADDEDNTPLDQEAIASLVTSIGKKTRQRAQEEPAIENDEEINQPDPAVEPEAIQAPAVEEPEEPEAPDEDIWRDEARRKTPSLKKEPVMLQTNGTDDAVAEKLQALRQRLERIERSAAEAQQLLTELGPQLDEVYTWVSDLDAVLSRWSRPRAAV
jgi:hypothetical protein